ncbi:MAG: IclR family transcriptional regulator C-terminal domain-containing protein [Solirubrobacteraceae bacterium]|jgi:IclR family pca regulon transcriptional regulator
MASKAARNGAAPFVQSLARGLTVIGALDAPEPLSLSDIARRSGLSRAAARRFVLTLEQLGYVRARDGRFMLTPRVLELGSAYLSSLTLPEIALPHIRGLVEEVRESGVLSVLDEDSIVGVARVPAGRVITGTVVLGQRLPAWASASGRVLLAWLPAQRREECVARAELTPLTARTLRSREALTAELERVRSQGFALVDQEFELGLRSLAVPVSDRDGAVIAAVALVLQSAAGPLEDVLQRFVTPLRATCAEIERDLAAAGARRGVVATLESVGA